MKKAMLLALAALSVSVAQAVTMNWTTESLVYDNAETKDDVTTNTSGTTLCAGTQTTVGAQYSAVIALSNLSSITSSTTLFYIEQWQNGRLTATYDTTNGLTIAHSSSGTSESVTVDSTAYVTITWDFNEEVSYTSDSTTVTTASPVITVYVNGEELFTVDSSLPNDFLNLKVTDSSGINGSAYVSDVTSYSGILTAAQIAAVQTQQSTVVPEPTVLALLALGVAGIALKRRA